MLVSCEARKGKRHRFFKQTALSGRADAESNPIQETQ